MKLPKQLLADLADAAELARRTEDPRRMQAAADWLQVISLEIRLAIHDQAPPPETASPL